MIEKTTYGIIYCAVGESYVKKAIESYKSILETNESLRASLYTDYCQENTVWHNTIALTNTYSISQNNEMNYKLDAILSTPYEKTLYLDADTFVLDNIEELFILLDKYDIVISHGHNRMERYNLIQQANRKTDYQLFPNNLPYCFAPLQGGLIIFNTSSTKNFFKTLKESYLSGNYFDDQAFIRELLWESDLRFYILPPEYNFNSLDYLKTLRRSKFEIAIPKIFHYTLNKEDDIHLLKRKLLRLKKPNNLSLKSLIKKLLGKIIHSGRPFKNGS